MAGAPHPRMHGATHVPGGPDPIPGLDFGGGDGGGGLGAFCIATAASLGSGGSPVATDFEFTAFQTNSLAATIDATNNIIVVEEGWYLLFAEVHHTGGGTNSYVNPRLLIQHSGTGYSYGNFQGVLISSQTDETLVSGQYGSGSVYLTHFHNSFGYPSPTGNYGVSLRLYSSGTPTIASASLGLLKLGP